MTCSLQTLISIRILIARYAMSADLQKTQYTYSSSICFLFCFVSFCFVFVCLFVCLIILSSGEIRTVMRSVESPGWFQFSIPILCFSWFILCLSLLFFFILQRLNIITKQNKYSQVPLMFYFFQVKSNVTN